MLSDEQVRSLTPAQKVIYDRQAALETLQERLAYSGGVILTREIFGTYPTDQKWAIINDEKAPKKYAQNKDPDLRKLEEEGIRDGLARLREGAETPPSGYKQ